MRSDEFDVTSEQDMRTLAAVLVGFMLLLIDTGSKRVRTESVFSQVYTLADGVSKLLESFETSTWSAFEKRLAKVVSEHSFGSTTAGKSQGKFMLVLADAASRGCVINLQAWQKYQYEHIAPVSERRMLDDTQLTEDERETLEQVYLGPDKALHRIGNGALRQDRTNQSLQNRSPQAKL